MTNFLDHYYKEALKASYEFLDNPVGLLKVDSQVESTKILSRQHNTIIILLVKIFQKLNSLEVEIGQIHSTINIQNQKIEILEKIAKNLTNQNNKQKTVIIENKEQNIDISSLIEDQFKALSIRTKQSRKGFSQKYIQG